MTDNPSSTAGPAQQTTIPEAEGTQEASSPSVEQEATPSGDGAPAPTEAELVEVERDEVSPPTDVEVVEAEGNGSEAAEDGTTYIAQI